MSKRVEINTKDEDFGAIVNCAVRYAIGRKTYIPQLVIDFILRILTHLSDNVLTVMVRDITAELNHLGYSTSQPAWKYLRDKAQEELDWRARNVH